MSSHTLADAVVVVAAATPHCVAVAAVLGALVCTAVAPSAFVAAHTRELLASLQIFHFFRPAQIKLRTVPGAACSLVVLCFWISLLGVAVDGLLNTRVSVVSARGQLEAALDEFLRDQNFELTIWHGHAAVLPPISFVASVPPQVSSILSDDLSTPLYYARSGAVSAWLWWRGDSWHSSAESSQFGGGPHEFLVGEIVRVPATHTVAESSEPGNITTDNEPSHRLARVVGVHPSRRLLQFNYSVRICCLGEECSQPSGASDPACIDMTRRRGGVPVGNDGKPLAYGLAVRGQSRPAYRATFGGSHARLCNVTAVPTEPLLADGPLRNSPAAIRGRVAVSLRGGCEFVEKAIHAQAAGAAALIIVNVDDLPVVAGLAPGLARNVSIPVFTVTRSVGQDLLQHRGPPFLITGDDDSREPVLSLAFGTQPVQLDPSVQNIDAAAFSIAGVRLSRRMPPQIKVATSEEMMWEDNWASIQASVVLTPNRMFIFQGYSFIHRGFWRVGEAPITGPSHPYTEAALQASPSLWLLSQVFCEAALPAHLGPANATANFSRDFAPAAAASLPLHVHCATSVAERRAGHARRWLRDQQAPDTLNGIQSVVGLAGLLLVRLIVHTCGRVLKILPAWGLLYAPAAFAASHLLRHVESPPNEFRTIAVVSAYTYVPLFIVEELSDHIDISASATGSLAWVYTTYGGSTLLYLVYTALAVRCLRATAPSDQPCTFAAFRRIWRMSPVKQPRTQEASLSQEQTRADLDTDSEPVCRICMDGLEMVSELGPLTAPCLCRGSMLLIHQSCLDRWRHASSNSRSIHECDNCKFQYIFYRPLMATVLRSTLALYVSAAAATLVVLVILAHAGKAIECGDAQPGVVPCVHLSSAGLSANDVVDALQPLASISLTQNDVDAWAPGLARAGQTVGLSVPELLTGLLLTGLGGFFSMGLLGPLIWRGSMAYQSKGLTVLFLGVLGLSRVFMKMFQFLEVRSRGMDAALSLADVGGGASAVRRWQAGRS